MRALGTILLLLGLLTSPLVADTARLDSLNALPADTVFSDLPGSIELYRDVAAEARDLGYPEGEARALRRLANAYYLHGRYEESVETGLAAARLLEDLDLPDELAMVYGNLGYQMKRRDLPRAKALMRQGVAIAERHDLREVLCALYDNYGVLMEMSAELDSAADYYGRALELKTALDDSVGIPFSLNNLASIHLERGEYARVAALLARSDAYRTRPGDDYGRLVNSVLWGDLYRQRGDADSAVVRYRESLVLPGAAEQPYLSSYCWEQLTALHAARGDYAAAFHSQGRLAALRDSLVDTETNERIAALEIEFETEKKDRELAESRLDVETRTRQVALLVGALLLVAVIAAGVVRAQAAKRRQLRRELELQGQVQRAEVERGVADEKLRIARDLHDNIGARLTFLISSVDNLAHGGGAVPERLAELGAFGRSALDELRQTVWAMQHADEGLAALELRLQDLKRQTAGTGVAVTVTLEREPDVSGALSSARLLDLYRVAQEAVQNALKHAEARQVAVRLDAGRAALRLSVSDDGRGFDPASIEPGSGLAHMRQRCEAAGGRFEVAADAAGVRVVAVFPTE